MFNNLSALWKEMLTCCFLHRASFLLTVVGVKAQCEPAVVVTLLQALLWIHCSCGNIWDHFLVLILAILAFSAQTQHLKKVHKTGSDKNIMTHSSGVSEIWRHMSETAVDFSKSARYLNRFKLPVRVTCSRLGDVNRQLWMNALSRRTAATAHFYSKYFFPLKKVG